MSGKELLIVMRRRTLPVIGQISKYAVLFSCICRKRQGLRFLCEMNAFPWKLDGFFLFFHYNGLDACRIFVPSNRV